MNESLKELVTQLTNEQLFAVWFLIGAALVFWMQAGFAMVEAGFTRAKNTGNIIMKNLMDFCIGTVTFILIGFGLLMGEDLIGLIGKPGFDLFSSYANFNFSSFVFNLVFCATTATIVSGAMAERTKFLSYCVYSGIISAVAVKLTNPIFESQTKNKLGNTDIRFDIVNQVKAAVAEALYKNPAMKAAILEKVAQNENVRKQIQAVKKGAKEQAQKTVLKIPKLRDCKYHLCDYDSKKKQEEKDKCAASMLFLTEGDSAAANMISARNPDYQAVFPLRGKPFNCQGKKKDTVYKNEELYFIMKSLGIEESMDDLRYGKIVIASDADVDGFHIRILLITFFLTFYQPLVLSDHLFILETPLFRVRNKKRNIYCYNERERAAAVSELGKGCEITRFKGLGEISPHEFGQFVDEGIRLQPVNIDNVKNIDSMLRFFMGDNTPERKDYIMRNCFFDLT